MQTACGTSASITQARDDEVCTSGEHRNQVGVYGPTSARLGMHLDGRYRQPLLNFISDELKQLSRFWFAVLYQKQMQLLTWEKLATSGKRQLLDFCTLEVWSQNFHDKCEPSSAFAGISDDESPASTKGFFHLRRKDSAEGCRRHDTLSARGRRNNKGELQGLQPNLLNQQVGAV